MKAVRHRAVRARERRAGARAGFRHHPPVPVRTARMAGSSIAAPAAAAYTDPARPMPRGEPCRTPVLVARGDLATLLETLAEMHTAAV
jgi:hypothetical protein